MPSANPNGTRQRATKAEKSLPIFDSQSLQRRIDNGPNADSFKIVQVLGMVPVPGWPGPAKDDVRRVEWTIPLGSVAGVGGIEDGHDGYPDRCGKMQRSGISANQEPGLARQRNELQQS